MNFFFFSDVSNTLFYHFMVILSFMMTNKMYLDNLVGYPVILSGSDWNLFELGESGLFFLPIP